MFSVWFRQSNYGVGVGPDPVFYISIVDNLTRGESLVSWAGGGSNPVFPFTVSIVVSSLGGLDAFSIGAYLNIIAFGLSILISIVWLSDKSTSPIFIIFGALACVLSPVLGNQHAVAETEPLFVLFVITSLFALDRFLDSNKEHWIILSAVFAALSTLTRHMGVALIISTLILITIRKSSVLAKTKSAVIYLAIVMPIIGVYALRNFLRYGQYTERQSVSGFNLSYSIDTLTSELVGWIFTSIGSDYLETVSRDFGINNILTGASILVILIILTAFFVYRLHIWQQGEDNRKISYQGSGELTTPIIYILTYMVVLLFILFIGDIGPILPRFLIPIYIPTVVVFTVILDRASRRIFSKVYLSGLYSSIGLWLALLAVANYDDIERWRDGYEQDYSSKHWIGSDTITYLKSNPIVGLIYSNETRAVYTHMRPNDARAYFGELPAYLPDLSIHSDWYRARNIDMHVVWFHGWKAYKGMPLFYDFMTLAEKENLQIIAVLADGIIFKNSQELTASDIDGLEATILQSILRDANLITADYALDVYLDGERLIYIGTSCNNTDIEDRFLLHIHPVDRSDVLKSRRNNDLDFNTYDFSFHEEGFFFGENCAVIRNLPDYDIKIIRTGQYTTDGVKLWEEEFRIRWPE